jgi:hypothetical protein
MNPSDDTDEEVEESEQDDGGGSIATARPPDGGSYSVQTLAAANMTDFLDQVNVTYTDIPTTLQS